jgi:hypothetical protein
MSSAELDLGESREAAAEPAPVPPPDIQSSPNSPQRHVEPMRRDDAHIAIRRGSNIFRVVARCFVEITFQTVRKAQVITDVALQRAGKQRCHAAQ